MLRAERFAAKLGLRIDPAAEATLRSLGDQLADVSSARLFEEVLKLFHGGHAHATFDLLRHYDLFRYLFPQTEKSLAREERHFPHVMVPKALENTDQRIAEDKPVNPAFLFAVLLWEPVRAETARHLAQGIHPAEAMTRAADDVIAAQLRQTAIPRRFSTPMREIWALQSKFERRHGRQAFRLFEHKRFRAAYDFMLLRAESGEIARDIGEWWTVFQTLDEEGRERMVRELAPDSTVAAPAKRRRRRRRGGGRGPAAPAVG
jgi:poly(A) polymerase